MSYYLYKLIPPRASFATDMSDAERAVMAEHVAYWRQLLEHGTALVFGPVDDPDGPWGLAIVAAESEQDVKDIGSADPAVVSKVARFEVHAMPGAIVGEQTAPG